VKPAIVLVTPAAAGANNGNWRTAQRWKHMLSERYRVTVCQSWARPEDAPHAHLMIALHARRSADAIAAWAQRQPDRGLIVVLTGTDLYGALQTDPISLQSLRGAHRIVALQSAARDDIPAELLPKLTVIYQSCTSRETLTKTHRYLRLVVVGHLRSEKAPQTVFELARRLRTETAIRIDHIGRALDHTLGEQARDLSATSPVYRWLGECSYPVTRQRIQRAHLLLHPSRVEGGAHVIMEAVCSGTPVLASRIAGNVGMLGHDYPGYFEFDDVESLAALVLRCRATMAGPQPWLDELGRYCQRRAVQFSPEHERAALLSLVRELL
jgi:putative glycosyltransferase (TIGR04348 family)